MHLFSDNTVLRSHLDAQFSFMHACSHKGLDLLCQISDMNLKLARQEIEGALYASGDIMACSNPMQMVQAAMRQIPPAAERWRSYQQHLLSMLSMLSSSQPDQAMLSGAAEARLRAAGRSESAIADEVLQRAAASAPVGGATDPASVIVSGNVFGSNNGNGNGSGSAAGKTQH